MGRPTGIVAFGLLGLVALAPSPSLGDVLVNTVTIPDPSGGFAAFASALAAAGENVLVSAPGLNHAYLYDGANGSQLTAFANPGGSGTAVAAIGDDVLLGGGSGEEDQYVRRLDAATGAYVSGYQRLSWNEFGTFGYALAVLGNNVVINDAATNGWIDPRVYLFDGTSGAVLLTISNPDAPAMPIGWGSVLATVDTDILVGGLGKVQRFNGTTGALVRTFVHPDPGYVYVPLSPGFGNAIAVSGNEVLINSFLFNATTGALLRTFNGTAWGPLAHLGDKVVIGADVFDRATGALLQTLPGAVLHLASSAAGRLMVVRDGPSPAGRNVAVYESKSCETAECDPDTDACCNPTTCRFDKCDPSVDPCCSATTCDFAQCNPEVNPCCDADTCAFKATNSECILTSGPNAGCRTGLCSASHACQPGGPVTLVPDDTACNSPQGACTVGECDGGVCLPPGGTGQPWADRCEDGNVCTQDGPACKTDITGAFLRCAFKDPAGFTPDETSCSTTSGAICTVKECQAGVCEPVSPSATIDCSGLPAVQACHANVCKLNAQGVPTCVGDEELPAGTVCEASVGSNDWDCKHFRCSNHARCRSKRASEGKVCDFAPGTTPTAHCNLGTCNVSGGCKNPLLSTFAVIEDMETAALDGNGNPVTADLPTCPSDNNTCTIDRCVGSSDACTNLCNVGFDCSVPGVCEGSCQTVGPNCTCVEAP